jgi:hypothetical protein
MFLALLSAVALAAVGSGATVEATTAVDRQVVVSKSGLVRGAPGSDYAEYGLVLTNRSRTRDALNVTVKVRALDSHGNSFTTDEATITVIPAATSFVVTGSLIWNVSLNLARIATVVHVGKSAPRGRRLPPVKHIAVTNYGRDITATLTNPYAKPLPDSATIYGIFLDSKGRIVAVGSQMTQAIVRPRATVAFDLSAGFSTTAQMDAVASAKVSIDPCGYKALTRACPLPS